MRKILATLAAAVVAVALVVAPATASQRAADKDLVATAVAAGSFKTLASLLQKSGLVGALKAADAQYTVFAPTDAAFKKVPAATLKKLAKSPALLEKVLLYHVVEGAVPAAQVVKLNGTSVPTLAGAKVKVKVTGGNVFLNGSSKVIKTDVMASNGVIHVINKVLMPPTK